MIPIILALITAACFGFVLGHYACWRMMRKSQAKADLRMREITERVEGIMSKEWDAAFKRLGLSYAPPSPPRPPHWQKPPSHNTPC